MRTLFYFPLPKSSPRPSKKMFSSIKGTQVPPHYCAWLWLTIFFQALIFYFISYIPSQSLSPIIDRKTLTIQTDQENCSLGKVYVYDLPHMFNKEFLDSCHDLDPWTSRCNAISNGGFGPKSNELAKITPENLTPAWYWTDMYAAEVIYHSRILKYKCRTEDQESASAFYIPFYAGIAVGKYLWYNHTAKERDFHPEMLMKWLQDQESWRRFNGSDHFIMLGRLTWDFRRLDDSGWGTRFLYMPFMKKVLRLSVERSEWDDLEFSVPYPTGFHPNSNSQVVRWQHFVTNHKRKSLFTFVGAARKKIKNDFRGILMEQCYRKRGSCHMVDCSVTRCYDGSPEILEAFLSSDFCLQPKGDGYTRRSMYDCMLAGSIPVFFWRRSIVNQYTWHLPAAPESYSVFIDRNDVIRNGTSVKEVLEKFSKEEVRRMREKVIESIPKFVYGDGEGLEMGKDAFDIAMEGVLRKFKERKEDGKRIVSYL